MNILLLSPPLSIINLSFQYQWLMTGKSEPENPRVRGVPKSNGCWETRFCWIRNKSISGHNEEYSVPNVLDPGWWRSSHNLTDNNVGSIYKIGNEIFSASETCFIHSIDTESLQAKERVKIYKFLISWNLEFTAQFVEQNKESVLNCT